MHRLLAFLLSVLAVSAFAHPGTHRHDSAIDVLNHLLSQPDHLALFVLVLTTGVVLLSLVNDQSLMAGQRDTDGSR